MHPLELFKYCPKCGSPHFEVNNEKSKRCADCGFVYYFNSSAATVAFILNDKNELLVCRREKNRQREHWTCPAGLLICMKPARKVWHARCWKKPALQVEEAVYQFSLPNTYLYSGFLVHTLDLFFLCKVKDTSRIKAMDDVAESFWLPLDEVNPEEFGLDSVREGVRRF